MNETRRIILLVVIAVSVMAGWHYIYEVPHNAALQKNRVMMAKPAVSNDILPSALEAPVNVEHVSRKQAVSSPNRVVITTPTLSGSINPQGAVIDDLILKEYKQTVAVDSPNIELLSPEGTDKPYNIQFDWIAADKNISLPDATTVWSAASTDLTPEKPVTFTWDNNQGLQFEKTFSVDKDYLFTVKQKVTNTSDKVVKLYPLAKIRRVSTPKTSGYMVLHEGPIGFINGKLEETKYDDLKEKKKVTYKSKGGWIGITDQFWLTAFIPEQVKDYEFFEKFVTSAQAGKEAYESGYFGDVVELKPGETQEVNNSVFAGAKKLDLLDAYEAKLGVEHFDKAVDFGWFYFITKPLFYLMQFLHQLVGNFGVAIIIITIIVRVLFYPLANKSFKSMARMKLLQPKMEKIKQQFSDDKLRMNQEMMELYKREKVNPLGGCLPMLLQMPVFFALYKVLFVSIEMRHAPFFGWIKDLSAPDPTSVFNLFGLIPWDPPTALMIGIWPLIMGATMVLQQKLNPAPADPVQAKMFMIMPIMFTYLFASFPAGLVIYWAWGNILSMAQQWVIMRSVNKGNAIVK